MFHSLELPNFNKARVLVCGDLMLDRYVFGSTARISPEAPVPVVAVETQKACPGGAANVALNLAAVGCDTTLLGLVGEDLESVDLRTQLEAQNIKCFFEYTELPTITKMRVLAQSQQMLRLDFESSFQSLNKDKLISKFNDFLTTVDVVVLSDYGKGTLTNVTELIASAREKNIPVLIDPKGKDYGLYSKASLITPNLSEFEAVVGHCGENDELIVTKARDLIRQYQFGAVLITRGKKGMSLIYADKTPPLHLHSQAREVFDVTGAGDTVIAMVSACLGAGLDLTQACELANLSAGLVVAKVGAAFVSEREIRNELRDHLGLNQGILTEKELLLAVEDAKARGEKIVMTNGCFDVLHAGHIQYLAEAKALGDRLIVAVNSDESVARLKGETRPIHSLAIRMEQLSALRAVDWVLPFHEDTPERLIRAVLPSVLVKGGDYTITQVAGHKAVHSNGGEVKILSFREGFSTTNILEKIS